MFQLLYILKYLQKNYFTIKAIVCTCYWSCAGSFSKIPFLCFHVMIFALPFPTSTLQFHPEFSLIHIFQPWLCSAIRGMEMEQTSTDGANNTTILWKFNTIYICCQVCCKFDHRNTYLKSIDTCCCMWFLLSTLSSSFPLYHPH